MSKPSVRKGRKAIERRLEPIDMRRYRESGVSVDEVAAMAGVSVATAMRDLAKLRKKMGPEKFSKEYQGRQAGHRARAHLYTQRASSQNPTPNTDTRS